MIKVGSTIYLELKQGEEDKTRYRSKILDYDSRQIYIDFPVDDKKRKPGFFLEGTQLKAWFLGKDEAVYLFETEVIGRKENKLPMIMLKDPGKSNYIRVQRRQYVRINTAVDTAVQSPSRAFDPFTTVTADLSGGGMALILPGKTDLKPGDKIKIWLSLAFQSGEIAYVPAEAELIRTRLEKGRLSGSFQFINIDERDRQKIVKFCFERQLVMIKKEKMS